MLLYRDNTLPDKCLATLDNDIVDAKITVYNMKYGMHLKCMPYKPHIYTIWYIKSDSAFDKNVMHYYPKKSVKLYCLRLGGIDRNKGQIRIILPCIRNFPWSFEKKDILYHIMVEEMNLNKECWNDAIFCNPVVYAWQQKREHRRLLFHMV